MRMPATGCNVEEGNHVEDTKCQPQHRDWRMSLMARLLAAAVLLILLAELASNLFNRSQSRCSCRTGCATCGCAAIFYARNRPPDRLSTASRPRLSISSMRSPTPFHGSFWPLGIHHRLQRCTSWKCGRSGTRPGSQGMSAHRGGFGGDRRVLPFLVPKFYTNL
jgi:hypothetical protein